MQTIAPSASVRRVLRLDAHAGECAPAYPALFATFYDHGMTPLLDVRALASRSDVLEAVRESESTVAIMSASTALRAIASGLRAGIVCAAVAPVDFAAIDLEPPVPWDRVGLGLRHLAPRAVLVASRAVLSRRPDDVREAIAAYWRGAVHATEAPALLGVVLATELGVSLEEADRVARRAVSAWRLDPAVRVGGLHMVAAALRSRRELPTDFECESALDERFVVAERVRSPRRAEACP